MIGRGGQGWHVVSVEGAVFTMQQGQEGNPRGEK